MSFSKRNRRIRQSPQIALSAVAEVVEPRVLLSVASVELLSTGAGADAVGTKELVIVAESYVSGYGTTQSLKIDEIRLVGNEVQVFSTTPSPHSWPGEFYPAYLETASVSVAPGAIASNSYRPAIAYILKSDPVSVTVPDREWKVVHFFSNIDQPRSDLYNLRTFGDSTLLYRRADADGDSGWLTTDIDPGAGSTVGLDFTAAPDAPTGLVSTSASATSNDVTFWFDESPTLAIVGQRFVRQYNIAIESNGSNIYIPGSKHIVVFDSQRFSMTAANGMVKTFGGSRTLNLPVGVYSWSVQVRDLPVFPEGATGANALATPWSEFSEPSHFSVLPQGQQILLGNVRTPLWSSVATIDWGAVNGAASYEVWINRISDGKNVLHQTRLSGLSLQTQPLDPDDYRVWVRATRADGTRTSWSKFKEFSIAPFSTLFGSNITPQGIVHDSTPTIEWPALPHSTQYRIALIDIAKEQTSRSMRFASPGALQQFITAYTRTVSGSSSSHTVETPIEAGSYRIELTFSFGNGKTAQDVGYLNLQPAGLPVPVPGMDGRFNWIGEVGAVSYDVWVAYLSQPDATNPTAPPKWKFDTQDGVTSGSYRLRVDAPAGNYRIWIRPNFAAAGQTTKSGWSAPADFTSQGPLYRPLSVTVQGEKLTWESVPSATGYRVITHSANGSTQLFTTTTLEFQIPDAFIDGQYSVRVEALDSNGSSHSSSSTVSVQHGTSPWTWNISKAAGMIEWNPVPDAVSYEVQIFPVNNFLPQNTNIAENTNITEPHYSLSSLSPGHYGFMVRALRSVNGHEFQTEWATLYADHGINAPTNVRIDGNILTWDAQENARYDVLIEIENGVVGSNSGLDRGFMLYYYPVSQYFSSGKIHASINSVDLSNYLHEVYSYDRAANIKISVQAIIDNTLPLNTDSFIATPLVSEWSEPIHLPLSHAAWVDPIIETAPQPKPSPPELIPPVGNDSSIASYVSPPSVNALNHIYHTENGAAVDLEYVKRFQVRVTDMRTGVVRTFDDSQFPELLQLQDDYEPPVLNYGYLDRPFRQPIVFLDLASVGSTSFSTSQFGLSSSVYKIEARVQYLPVILSASTSDADKFSLTDTQSDHINVAATPWSDWSTPLEYTMLPDGQNILPIANSAGTIDPRPTFAWGSNTPDAKYELWVENRTTKQRVIHETLRNVHQFKAMTDLPPGQYDWWVRIVGTTGARNGWSFKQSLEVYVPAITTSVVTETADATPVVSWTSVTGAQSYVVTLTSTATGKVVYTGTAVASTGFHRVATTLPNDTYTVSIQAMLPNGARTAPGVANSRGGFVLKRMTVGVAPKIATFSATKVTWQPVDGATKYDVWINYVSSAGKMERILRQDAFGIEIQLPANLTSRAGEYRVWIRAIRNEAGQQYTGRWSDVKTLIVGSATRSLNASALILVMSELATSGLQL